MTPIKLFVSDLDDTLLSEDRQISLEAVAAISRLEEHGIAFTFITGRPLTAIRSFAAQVRLTAPVIGCNGACVADPALAEILSGRSLDLGPLETLLANASTLGMTVLIATGFAEYAVSRTGWTEARRRLGREYQLRQSADFTGVPVFKATIINHENSAGFAEMTPAIDALQGEYSVSRYGSNGCEIVAAGADKAAGLDALCAQLGIRAEEALAIGDNINDIPMLRHAGTGVAVANAKPPVKAAADFVTAASRTAGVVEAIRRFIPQEARS